MSKVLIGINTLIAINPYVYGNHWQFSFRLGRNHRKDQFALFNPVRMSVDRMRNSAAQFALEGGFDYIFFVDDDVMIPFDAYDKLKKANKDIIAGVTLIRGYPFYPMIFDFKRKKNNHVIDYERKANKRTKLLTCDAVGFSCCLIKTSILKEIPQPYFVTGTKSTEDVYFCIKAKEYIPKVKIFVHTGISTIHCIGMEFISPENKKIWIKHMEAEHPGIKKSSDKPKQTDRGEDYLKQNEIETV